MFGIEPTVLLFYTFATVLVGAALAVITSRNPVYSVLFLVLCFFTAAGLWILLEVEFLGLGLIVVYVGAVMVLFLFVIMMLQGPVLEGERKLLAVPLWPAVAIPPRKP